VVMIASSRPQTKTLPSPVWGELHQAMTKVGPLAMISTYQYFLVAPLLDLDAIKRIALLLYHLSSCLVHGMRSYHKLDPCRGPVIWLGGRGVWRDDGWVIGERR